MYAILPLDDTSTFTLADKSKKPSIMTLDIHLQNKISYCVLAFQFLKPADGQHIRAMFLNIVPQDPIRDLWNQNYLLAYTEKQ